MTALALTALIIPASATSADSATSSRTELKQRVHKSTDVLEFFNNHPWMIAASRQSCLQIAWTRTCLRARERVRFHTRQLRQDRSVLYRYLPNVNDWRTAAQIVQRAFPGTFSWLMSCSSVEGGHGRWVRYGGGPYYPGYEHTDQVGNWLQYRWSTFKGHYRHGLDSLRSRGFRVDLPPPEDVRAWLSPLGAAIAGGWARWSGNDASHWSASWNTGCR